MDLARSAPAGFDLRCARSSQRSSLHPDGDADPGARNRNSVERLSSGADKSPGRLGSGSRFARPADAPRARMTSLTYPELTFYAENATSFRSVIGLSERNPATFSDEAAGSTPEPVNVAFATANYFPEFGITPTLGRVLTTDDERADAEPAALVGESFWQRRLGGEASVIGKSIRVNGKLLRVIGVMPRSSQAGGD